MGVGRADLAAMGLGERQVGEQVRLGRGQQRGDRREARPEAVDHPVELLVGGHPSGCSMTIRIAEGTMLRALRGTRSWALRVRWTRSVHA